MTAIEKENKIQAHKLQITDRCAEICSASRELQKTEDITSILKVCRRIEDAIVEIRRINKKVEDLEYTPIE